jgi:hypothetical protein
MQFKTKDLLVTVVPKAAANEELAKVCLLHTIVCINPTFCQHPTFCQTPSLCVQPTFCRHPTLCGPCSRLISCLGCSVQISGGCGIFHSCGPDGSVCDPTIFCAGASQDPFVIKHREDLVSLRADLKDTLARLDQIEKQGLPSSIGSKEEAEALESSLTAALEQVRASKKGLK